MKTEIATALLVTLATGCMTGSNAEPPLSYEEFKTRYVATTQAGDGSELMVYDWDQPLRSEAEVEKLYEAYLAAKVGGETLSEATVNADIFGNLDKWTAAQALELTYCVSDKFPNKAAVVSAMAKAAADWNTASNGKVTYVHQAQYDASCTTTTPVVFDVNPGTNAYAVAFFPSWERSRRSVLIHPATFNGTFPPEGILRHELGHTLGLRHETTRIEAAIEYGFHCFEDIFNKELTEYDNKSVMTTPACMGDAIVNKTLSLSARDVEGIRRLYR